MADERADVYSRITDEIVTAIEVGAGKWKMPWHHDGSVTSRPINLASKKPYRGISADPVIVRENWRCFGFLGL